MQIAPGKLALIGYQFGIYAGLGYAGDLSGLMSLAELCLHSIGILSPDVGFHCIFDRNHQISSTHLH